MKVVAVHVPVRPRPETIEGGRSVGTLIQRNAFLAFLRDDTENVFILTVRCPAGPAGISVVQRAGMVETIRHLDIRQPRILVHFELPGEWYKIVLQPVQRSLKKETRQARTQAEGGEQGIPGTGADQCLPF